MATETWEIKNLKDEFDRTKIFCQNEGDEKWVFVRSYHYGTLYIKLWCDSQTEQSAEVNSYGIGGFNVPDDYRHRQVQVGVSLNNQDWKWVTHSYHNGTTS